MENIEKIEPVQVKAEVTEKPIEALSKPSYGNFMSDTPKWAKIVRFCGWGLTAIGGALLTSNPVTVPLVAGLIPYAGYITLGGTAIGLFVQGFSKKQ